MDGDKNDRRWQTRRGIKINYTIACRYRSSGEWEWPWAWMGCFHGNACLHMLHPFSTKYSRFITLAVNDDTTLRRHSELRL